MLIGKKNKAWGFVFVLNVLFSGGKMNHLAAMGKKIFVVSEEPVSDEVVAALCAVHGEEAEIIRSHKKPNDFDLGKYMKAIAPGRCYVKGPPLIPIYSATKDAPEIPLGIIAQNDDGTLAVFQSYKGKTTQLHPIAAI